MKTTMFALLPALALLAACGNDNTAPVPEDNGVAALDVTNAAGDVPEAPPAAEMANMAPAENVAVDDAPPVAVDEQVQDDADATGMTARVDRSEGADDAQPAEGATTSEEKR